MLDQLDDAAFAELPTPQRLAIDRVLLRVSADGPVTRFWQDDDMPGLRGYIFEDVRPTFVKLFHGWAERERLALEADARLDRD